MDSKVKKDKCNLIGTINRRSRVVLGRRPQLSAHSDRRCRYEHHALNDEHYAVNAAHRHKVIVEMTKIRGKHITTAVAIE